MSKNIVIFSDGTGQEGGKGHNTNVYKLFNMIEDRTPHQISFYDRGLGTNWRKFTGQFFGMGISRNIRDCYRFIFENYQAGDRIYLFGFSRGAYTVRSLSGFIDLIGILPRSRPELIKKAYRIYRSKRDSRKDRAARFTKLHHTMKAPVKFIGVWDTVKALGIPIRSIAVAVDKLFGNRRFFATKFHNHDLCKNVECGFHALSIDDRRKNFHPTFWDEKNAAPEQTVKQVWFAGVHTDVGGGYREQGLSDITLEWMVEQATAHGLRIYHDHKVAIRPCPNDKMHDPFEGIGFVYPEKTRSLNCIIKRPLIHQSVFERKLDIYNSPDNKYEPWLLAFDYDTEPWIKRF